jgi:hypothetical protein
MKSDNPNFPEYYFRVAVYGIAPGLANYLVLYYWHCNNI